MKVKYFKTGTFGTKKIEAEINKFIKDKKVINIKMSLGIVLLMYE